MSKTEKELAFLHGIYVEEAWTSKFAAVVDKVVKVKDFETILYINAGTGNHALEICAKLGRDSQIFAVCENEELQSLAQEKSNALKADIDFSTSNPLAESSVVIADASFVSRADTKRFLSDVAGLSNDRVAFFLPTSGSFGEVYSFLWEVFLDLGLAKKNGYVESLIKSLYSVSEIEEIADGLGLKKIKSTTKSEFLEFENGLEFVNAPLIKYFLLPGWLSFLSEKEKEQVIGQLAQKIDNERDDLSFHCSVKATIVTAGKN